MKPLDQMPESTAWRLHLASTGSYIASIQCLRDRRSSLGGYILMRGLLEAWSHLDFIADDAQGGSSALRAIRYEAGLIHEWEGTAHDVPGGAPDESQQITSDKKGDLDRLWKQHDGPGTAGTPRRTRSHVLSSLQIIRKREDLDWLVGLYRSTSGATHMLGTNFMLQSSNGTTTVAWATPAQRCSWLIEATACFERLSRTTIELMGGDDVAKVQAEFNVRGHAIVNDQFVRSHL